MVLILSDEEIREVLSFNDTLQTCCDVFRWVGEEKIVQVPSHHIVYEAEKGKNVLFGTNGPALISPINALGVKANGRSDLAKDRNLPFVNGVIVLVDWKTLEVLAMLDESYITSMRTAGHAGVGARCLARKDSAIIAIIGCGVEGRTHLGIMNELFGIEVVKIFSSRIEAMNVFAKEMGEKFALQIQVCGSALEAVSDADVICMCTNSKETVVDENWIKPGGHVCATWAFHDLDYRYSAKANKWVLGWEGDYQNVVLRDPRLDEANVYSYLTEIITGRKRGRENAEERTVMTCLGMGALDVAVAQIAFEKAKIQKMGHEIAIK